MDKDAKLFFREYAFATAVVGVSTAVCFAIFPHLELTNLVMIYLLGTLTVAMRGHRGAAALASTLSVLAFDFCFVPPRFTFRVSDVQYVWTFTVMFAAAMVISHLTIRLRSEAEAARQGQKRTAMMHAFTQQLAATRSLDKVLQIAVRNLIETFDGTATIFLPSDDHHLKANSPATDKELGVAQWVYDKSEPAGMGTGSIPDEDSLYVPMKGAEGPVGVLKIKPRAAGLAFSSEQRLLLDSFAHQIASALEIDRLAQTANRAEVDAETERMRSSLLSSVSHDFRTPLTAIVGSAGALLGKENVRSNSTTRELAENIQEEGERLSRLIQNLLETTRLESGAISVRKELYPLEEVIGSALERLEKQLNKRVVKVDVPADLPAVPMDGLMIEQVFINLLENAVRHTPAGSPIEVWAGAEEGSVRVSVSDHGAGLKGDELERVFDKFYHAPSSTGAGLGLAICRAIVKAHGGTIFASNRAGGGAVFCFTLPLAASGDTSANAVGGIK